MTESSKQRPRGECVEWTGIIQPNGYGRLHINNTGIGAHRLAWALRHGRSPRRGMDICHACDNRKCVNPDHLFEGSRSDNMQDASKKQRMFSPNKDKMFCIRGHKFTRENTFIRKCGRRGCKQCRTEYNRIYRKSYERPSYEGA